MLNRFRQFFNGSSIQKKLLVPLLAMVLVLFALSAASQLLSIKIRSEKDIQDKLSTTVRLASLAYSNALWNYNYDAMADIANAMLMDTEIGLISVKTSAGRAVFSKGTQGPAYEPRYMSYVESMIHYQSQPIGIVRIGVSTYQRQMALQQALIKISVFLVISIFAVVMIITRVALSVSEPIKRLEQSTDVFALGNLDQRIHMDSHDEVGRLAEKFNKMAEKLSDIIKERDEVTEELISSNEALAATNTRQIDEIKERILAQEALAASEEKYGKAFRNLAEVLGLTRISDKKYLEINEVFFKALGYSQQEVLGHSSEDFELWESDQDRNRFFELLQTNGSVKNFESRWMTKNRELRIGLQSAEIVTIGGEPFEIFIWNDITERKQAEDALKIAHDQLEIKVDERTSELMAMNEELIAMNDELVFTLDRLKKTQQLLLHSEKMAALGGLVAGMSHEISTPIGIGVTSVSYVQKEMVEIKKHVLEGTLTKEVFEEFLSESTYFLQTTSKNLERADLLIRSFKQISVDQTTEDKRRFKVKPYLDELLLSLNSLFRNRSFQVSVECADTLEIVSYPGLIAQIITNLITNSLRHGFDNAESGILQISFDKLGNLYTLTYSDNGKGMTDDIQEHIYEPFFTTKRGSEGGTGLGLHLVYNIVTQQLGGEIRCFSLPNEGAKFIITFPDIFGE